MSEEEKMNLFCPILFHLRPSTLVNISSNKIMGGRKREKREGEGEGEGEEEGGGGKLHEGGDIYTKDGPSPAVSLKSVLEHVLCVCLFLLALLFSFQGI